MKPCDLACIRRWRALFMMALLTSGPTAVALRSGTRWSVDLNDEALRSGGPHPWYS